MLELVGGHGKWHRLYTATRQTFGPVSVYLEVWTNQQRFSHREVDVDLSNFRVNSGALICPSS